MQWIDTTKLWITFFCSIFQNTFQNCSIWNLIENKWKMQTNDKRIKRYTMPNWMKGADQLCLVRSESFDEDILLKKDNLIATLFHHIKINLNGIWNSILVFYIYQHYKVEKKSYKSVRSNSLHFCTSLDVHWSSYPLQK